MPISLGLIIDTSASMTDKRDRVASAALAMVKASNPEDEVFDDLPIPVEDRHIQNNQPRIAPERNVLTG